MTRSSAIRFNAAAIAFALALLPGMAAVGAETGISPEDRCSPYDRGKYRYSQNVEDRIIQYYGAVYSPYTGEYFSSKHDTDIDHIVALSEAHDSGLCAASSEVMRQFANDPLNLTLASPSLNRGAKGAADAAEWLPDINRCWFANRVLVVKHKYSLSVDQQEAEVLTEITEECESSAMLFSERSYREATEFLEQ